MSTQEIKKLLKEAKIIAKFSVTKNQIDVKYQNDLAKVIALLKEKLPQISVAYGFYK